MLTKNITITKLSPDAWQTYRDIRLKALQTDPQAFGSSYIEEQECPEAQWRSGIDTMWFALVDDQVAGMIRLFRETGPYAHCAHVMSVWVNPAYRGLGVGKKLVQHLQTYASSQGLRKLYLHVTSTQEDAIKLYYTSGFEKVGILKNHAYHNHDYFDVWLMEWHIPEK